MTKYLHRLTNAARIYGDVQIQIKQSKNYIPEPLKEVKMAVDQDLDCQDDDVAVRFFFSR